MSNFDTHLINNVSIIIYKSWTLKKFIEVLNKFNNEKNFTTYNFDE
jgi:hypothetical protein